MNTEDKISNQYKGEEGERYHAALHNIPKAAYPWIANLRKEKFFRFIDKNDALLEYGVGPGWNIAHLDCREKMGFDIAGHLKNLIQSKGINFVEEIDNISDESIDTVICHHVIEHVSEPTKVLSKTKRILKKEGRLLLFAPYEKGKAYQTYNPSDPNHHLYSWTVQTLATLVEKSGFKIIQAKLGRFGYDRFAGVWANRLGLSEKGFRAIRKTAHLLKPNHEIRIVAQKNIS